MRLRLSTHRRVLVHGATLSLLLTALAGVATLAATSGEPDGLSLVTSGQDLSAALAGESRPPGIVERYEEVVVLLAAHRQRERLEAADVHTRAVAPPESDPVPEASPPATDPVPEAPSSRAVWDDIAACESSGDWTIDTGNGYYGGLQFEHRSWH